eukprot:8780571-Pyramimonas_sp.AAC.1
MPGITGIPLEQPCCAPPVGSVGHVPDGPLAAGEDAPLHFLIGSRDQLHRWRFVWSVGGPGPALTT